MNLKFLEIPCDKALHFVFGAVITLLVLCALTFGGIAHGVAKALALAAAIVVGALKEYMLDSRMNKIAAEGGLPEAHSVYRGDVIATSLGGLAIWLA